MKKTIKKTVAKATAKKAVRTAKTTKTAKAAKTVKATATVAKKAAPAKKAKGKATATPNGLWNDFVFHTLEKTGKLHTTSQIVELAKQKLDVKRMTASQVRLGIARVLSRHETRSGKLRLYTPTGKRPAFYGLSDWFDVKGKVKPAFAKKLAV